MDKILSKEEVREWIETDDWAKTIAKEFEDVFKKHFYLSEEEVEEKIEEIFSRNRINIAENLLGVFSKFVQLENDDDLALDLSHDEKSRQLVRRRNKFAETAVDKVLEYYLDQEKTIKDEFFVTLNKAKSGLKVDTRALAKIGVFNKASVKTYNAMIKVLVENDYKDNMQNVTFNIFDIIEDEETIKNLVEDCTTLMYKTSAKNIQEILDYISIFMWDNDTQKYVLSPKECFKRAHTLLTISPKTLKDNINFLESHFGKTKEEHKELVNRVAISPSILQIKPKKVEEFLSKLADCYVSLGMEDFKAIDKASAFCYNIDNLIMISSVTNKQMKNIEEVKEILLKYGFGNENAISCMTSPYFIKTEPKILDAVLAKISSKEDFEQKNIKKLLIETSSVLDTSSESGDKLRTREGSPKKSRRAVAKETDDKQISENVFQEKYEKLSKDERKEVDAILENLTNRKEKKRRTNTTTRTGKDNAGNSNNKKKPDNKLVIPDFSDCASEYPFVEILNRSQKFVENNMALDDLQMLKEIEDLKKKYIKFCKAMQFKPEIYQQMKKFGETMQDINKHLVNRDYKNFDKLVNDAIRNNYEICSQLKECHSNIRKFYLGSQAEYRKLGKGGVKNNLGHTLANATYITTFLNRLNAMISVKVIGNIKPNAVNKAENVNLEELYEFMTKYDQFRQIIPNELMSKFKQSPLPENEFIVLATKAFNDYELLRDLQESYEEILSEQMNPSMNLIESDTTQLKVLENMLIASERLQKNLSEQGMKLYRILPVGGALKRCDGELFLQLKNSCIDIPNFNKNFDAFDIEEVDRASKPKVLFALDYTSYEKYWASLIEKIEFNDDSKNTD